MNLKISGILLHNFYHASLEDASVIEETVLFISLLQGNLGLPVLVPHIYPPLLVAVGGKGVPFVQKHNREFGWSNESEAPTAPHWTGTLLHLPKEPKLSALLGRSEDNLNS